MRILHIIIAVLVTVNCLAQQSQVGSGTGGIATSGGFGTNTTLYGRLTLSSNIVTTASGGNARGNNATDLQTLRIDATNVASGLGSSILGGRNSTVSGHYSTVVGGTNHWLTGPVSVICAGDNGYITGDNCFIGAAYADLGAGGVGIFNGAKGLNVTGHNSGIMVGEDSAVNASQSAILVGNDCTVNGTFSATVAGNANVIYGDNTSGFGHGSHCFIAAGTNNRIGQGHAGIFDGDNTFTDGPSYASILGAFNYAAAGADIGTIIGGRNNKVSAIGAIAVGSYNTNANNFGVMIGYSNNVTLSVSPDLGVQVYGEGTHGGKLYAAKTITATNGFIFTSNTYPITAWSALGNSGCITWMSNATLYLICTNSINGNATTNKLGGL